MLIVPSCVHAMTLGLVHAWHVKSTQVQLFLRLQIQLLLLPPVRRLLAAPPTKMRVVGRRMRSVLASCRNSHPTALFNTGPGVLEPAEILCDIHAFFQGRIHSCHPRLEGVSNPQTVKPHPSHIQGFLSISHCTIWTRFECLS